MSVPQDFRYGLRRLSRNAAFSTFAALCVALGIGPSAAVFSLANVFLLRPVPGVERSAGLVSLQAREPVKLAGMESVEGSTGLSYPDYLRYRVATRTLRHLAAYVPTTVTLVSPGVEARRLDALFVTDNYFAALDARPLLGRLFAPGEREPERIAVVSEDLWRRSLGARDGLAGISVEVNGQALFIVGVAPRGFRGIQHGDTVDLWLLPQAGRVVIPAPYRPSLDDPETGWAMWLVARLAPGATVEDAQEELRSLALRLADPGPAEHRPARLEVHAGIGVWPWQRAGLARYLVLLGAVGLLLILAVCANLGGLLLVRAAARQEEIGVRLALGVTRWRIVRQLLIESLVLSAVGGAVGLAFAFAAAKTFEGVLLGPFLPRLGEIPIDARVLLFALALSFVVGISFGLVPALWVFRRRPQPLVRQSASSPDPTHVRLQESLVVGQVTLSVVLLVATGLFVRTLINLAAVDPGFEPAQVLNLRFDLAGSRYDEARRAKLCELLLARIETLPQVRSASLASMVPLGVPPGSGSIVSLLPSEGETAAEVFVDLNSVSPGYFETLGIPVGPGRDFMAGDADPVVIDATLAKRYWPGRSPIGARVRVSGKVREVVGVAGAVHLYNLVSGLHPVVYVPLAGSPESSLTLQVRVQGAKRAALDAVKAAVAGVDPSLPVTGVGSYEEEVAQAFATWRVLSWLCSAISAIALVVTSFGLYGTLSYTVSRRTRELGIRIALGARSSQIVAMVVLRGLVVTLSGLALGMFVAVWTTTSLTEFLFEVEPDDPAVFCGVGALLLLIALAASWLPARAAARVDPLTVIRHE